MERCFVRKKYNDAKTSWSSFEQGEMVCVFIIIYLFSSEKRWVFSYAYVVLESPYQVQKKLSDVLYTVACGFKRRSTAIHCDRMRKYQAQTLIEDNCNEKSQERHEVESDDEQPLADLNVDGHEHRTAIDERGTSANSRPQRARNVPKWLLDNEVDYSL